MCNGDVQYAFNAILQCWFVCTCVFSFFFYMFALFAYQHMQNLRIHLFTIRCRYAMSMSSPSSSSSMTTLQLLSFQLSILATHAVIICIYEPIKMSFFTFPQRDFIAFSYMHFLFFLSSFSVLFLSMFLCTSSFFMDINGIYTHIFPISFLNWTLEYLKGFTNQMPFTHQLNRHPIRIERYVCQMCKVFLWTNIIYFIGHWYFEFLITFAWWPIIRQLWWTDCIQFLGWNGFTFTTKQSSQIKHWLPAPFDS